MSRPQQWKCPYVLKLFFSHWILQYRYSTFCDPNVYCTIELCTASHIIGIIKCKHFKVGLTLYGCLTPKDCFHYFNQLFYNVLNISVHNSMHTFSKTSFIMYDSSWNTGCYSGTTRTVSSRFNCGYTFIGKSAAVIQHYQLLSKI